MKTPLDLLKTELTTLKFVSSGRLMTRTRREAKEMIPLYEEAINLLSQPSDVSDEIKDIIDCIIKYDKDDSDRNKASFFNIIQRDLKKVMSDIKLTIKSDASDEDIRTQAGNESRRLTASSLYKSGFYDGYILGAKARRDGQIKPTIEGECIHLKTQDSVCGWSVDHICNTKDCPAYNPPKVYYCTICQKNPVDAENGYDTCQDCINKV